MIQATHYNQISPDHRFLSFANNLMLYKILGHINLLVMIIRQIGICLH